MKYIKNEAMDFMEIDDENMAIYDPDTGDTHYIDEIGMVILSYLDEAIDEEALVDALCEQFEADREIIAADVHTFLSELVSKKVVLAE